MARIKHNWTQDDESVVISYPIKGLNPSDVEAEFAPFECSVTLSLLIGAEAYFNFDPLSGEIDPAKSYVQVLSDVVNVNLHKKNTGIQWKTLTADEAEDIESNIQTTDLDAPTGDSAPIQIMSDLHLEFQFNNPNGPGSIPGYEFFQFPRVAPNLALLGDIGLACHDGLFGFLERQVRRFEKVFFVMGNHEGYESTYDVARSRLQEFAETMRAQRLDDDVGNVGEFIFLDRTRYDLTATLTILGCPLWSSIPPSTAPYVSRGLNDFVQVENWTVDDYNSAHDGDVQWLNSQCAQIKRHEPGRRVVIFTHHAPVVGTTSSPVHKGSPIGAGFATEMSGQPCWGMDGLVRVWAFGHTHWNCDFKKQDVRVVCNQRGYEGDRTHGFNADRVFHL